MTVATASTIQPPHNRCSHSLTFSEASSEIGDDSFSHTPVRASHVAAAAAQWLRLSAADLNAIRESIHLEASTAPFQDLSSSPVSLRNLALQSNARDGHGRRERERLQRSPGACIRESIHPEGGFFEAGIGCDDKAAPWEHEGEAACVRDSVHLPPSSPPTVTSRMSTADCWGVESPRGDATYERGVGGGGSLAGTLGGSLAGTLSIVERIQQLDRQKKQAVARLGGGRWGGLIGDSGRCGFVHV